MNEIENNLIKIRKFISEYEKKYGREPGSVCLLAASKGQSIEKITAAYHTGQHRFGESYLQEALLKIQAFSDISPDKPIEWHFIGSIQSNKTRKIAEHFSWVHSVSSMKIAKRLNDQRPDYLPKLNICIEVNVSHEKTKSGIASDAVMVLASYCTSLPRLQLRGLMTIPAAHETIEDQRKEFHQLNTLWRSLKEAGIQVDTLSMGMSEDFEAAIAEGSTLVRIGTAIFGQRL